MTAADLAHIHAACFTTPRAWSEAELTGFLSDPLCDLIEGADGFALIRTIADEAELLTLAVAPTQQGNGQGRMILFKALETARARGAAHMFLEVASDNAGAIHLYETAGFKRTGLRKAYYRRADGSRLDALLFSRDLRAGPG